jgi:formamidopyrimidine-DNA glycosylase
MPELPEVETICRDLESLVIGLSIKGVSIYDARVIRNLHKGDFDKLLAGYKIVSLKRRAKGIIFGLQHTRTNKAMFLMVHLKMTGQLIYGDNLKETAQLKETKVVFALSNGSCLNYNDQRLFGRLILTDDLKHVPYLNNLGIEPLSKEFNADWLATALTGQSLSGKKMADAAKFYSARRRTPIKVFLMAQNVVTGIGNIYASEILFDAGIHPQKSVSDLSNEEIKALHKSIQTVLQRAIRLRGTSMRNYRDSKGSKGNFISRIKVYAKENGPCVQCGQMIKRVFQAGRSTFYCEHCQN